MTFNLASPDFLRRLAVTLGALLVMLSVTAIPLPGIDLLKMWASGYAVLLSPLSVGGMMLIPVITALSLAQLVWLLGPRRWSSGLGASAVPGWVQWLALALAVLQAGGIATAIEGVPGVVAEPGTAFRVGCVASLTAGTFLIWWLAGVVTRNGLGSGLWLIFVMPFISGLTASAGDLPRAFAIGQLSAPALIPIIAFLVASVGSVAALVITGPGGDGGEALLWPLLLASTALDLMAYPLALWDSMTGHNWVNVIFLGPFRIVMLVGLIFVFVHLWNRKRAEVVVSPARSALQSVTISAIVIAAEMLWHVAPQAGVSSSIVIVTLVMLNILRGTR